jgi:tRNA (cytidine/uridine-2'-O-)-methyltransferase
MVGLPDMHVVLVEPEIPPNTGNIARLCAAARIPLHLAGPLGFRLTDRRLRRAGLDYWEFLELHRHESAVEWLANVPASRLHLFSARGVNSYTKAAFKEGDYLVFGSETRGLPGWLLDRYPDRIWNVPMFHPGVRSLNLSSVVAIVVYEALRQLGRV